MFKEWFFHDKIIPKNIFSLVPLGINEFAIVFYVKNFIKLYSEDGVGR